jgi:hypothetical protein
VELMAQFFVSMPPSADYSPGAWGLIIKLGSSRLVAQALINAGAAPGARGNILSFDNEKDGARRRKSERPSSGSRVKPRAKDKTPPDSPEVGRALRSVYDDTLNEKIPTDLLDLLGKLG